MGKAQFPPRHGELLGYVDDGCRCVQCRGAMTNYKRTHRAARKGRPETPHGTADGYFNWACRCFECNAAVRDYNRFLAGAS